MIKVKRHVASPLSGLVLSATAAAILLAAATFDLWMVQRLVPGEPLALSVRIPLVGMYKDTYTAGASYRHVRIIHGRHTTLAPRETRLLRAYEEARRPPSNALMLGLGLAALLLFWLFTSYLRVLSGTAKFLRTNVVLVGLVLVLVLLNKLVLVLTSWSALWVPLLAVVVPVALHLGRRVAAATSVASATALSLLTPIDFPVLIVIVCQGLAVSATVRPHGQIRMTLAGTLAASAAGLLAHAALSLLLQHSVRVDGLTIGPMAISPWLESDLAASFGSPIVGGVVALALAPIVQQMLRQVSRTRLASLADFEHPLLRRLATRAPGTWAHSLSMANLAEMAANAIHANGLLVRVGAYYHDVGKSLQPDYFIENQAGGNPHDQLEPEVSADAIVSHVDEGIKLARKQKLPHAVLEFIYTHHGTDRLEYFWHKKRQTEKNDKRERDGDPDDSDFRYHGLRPQTRETGILALCDAVEAAARSMESPDLKSIRQLVRQIVFTKLLTGVLDQSGLTIAELRTVTESMIDTLRNSLHTRVKYPWQQEAKAGESSPSGEPPATAKVNEASSREEQRSGTATYAAARPGNGQTAAAPSADEIRPGARGKAYTKRMGVVPEVAPDDEQGSDKG